jgi:hypothetical protein
MATYHGGFALIGLSCVADGMELKLVSGRGTDKRDRFCFLKYARFT